jgi:hypothetical protein
LDGGAVVVVGVVVVVVVVAAGAAGIAFGVAACDSNVWLVPDVVRTLEGLGVVTAVVVEVVGALVVVFASVLW